MSSKAKDKKTMGREGQERSRRTIRRVLRSIDKYRASVLLSLFLAVVTVALTL